MKHDASPTETAHYIASITADLTEMASEADLRFIAYLLGLAHQEAAREASGCPAPRSRLTAAVR